MLHNIAVPLSNQCRNLAICWSLLWDSMNSSWAQFSGGSGLLHWNLIETNSIIII
jgi:hypothetical protein